MKDKIELLDDSIKELTNLRVSLIHNDFLEKKVYDIEANLCKLHDLLSTPQPEANDPYSYWPCCDVQGCDQVSCNGGGCWSDTGYWSVCQDHSAMFRDGILPQPVMKESSIRREMTRDENGYLPIKQQGKESVFYCKSSSDCAHKKEDKCTDYGIICEHKSIKPPKPKGAKEWNNKVMLHLHSLDMADFFLEIYASRDTFSRAKIMEMFRDYHIHKVANIKKVMQEKLDESKDELNDPMLNSGALGYFEGRETVLIELLTEL